MQEKIEERNRTHRRISRSLMDRHTNRELLLLELFHAILILVRCRLSLNQGTPTDTLHLATCNL